MLILNNNDKAFFCSTAQYANAWQRASMYDADPLSEQPIRTLLHDLLYDAVHVFANALRNVSYSYQIRPPRVRCDFTEYEQMQPWPMGRYIYRVMLAVICYHLDTQQIFDLYIRLVGFSDIRRQ